MINIVILISGRGSNMRAVIEAAEHHQWPAQVVAVISNRPDAEGLAYAASKCIPTAVVESKKFGSREQFDVALQDEIDRFDPQLVVLAGFMRILTPKLVQHYEGRMLNIHPSLLPSFKGLSTHRQALEAGVKLHGATVHFVTADLDHGPIIAQVAVAVLADDNEVTLSQRVLEQEHQIYPTAIGWFVAGRLTIEHGKVSLRDDPITL
jgi:phosphoribosylglycinamide formyltransferase-1